MPDANQQRYGALWPLVRTAGCLMAAVGAIALAWRGRTDWEPSEQDIPQGPDKVAALVTAVLIAIIYVTMSNSTFRRRLIRLALLFASGCVVALLVYGFLVGTQTYDRKVVIPPNQIASEKIIGGFWLTSEAIESQEKYHKTTQELLAGAGYDPDIIWSRPSRSLAKLCFTVSYICLTVCGSLALASASVILTLQRLRHNKAESTPV